MVLTRASSLALALALIASPAAAGPRDEAKALADSAYALLQQGLYEEAIDLFRRADERFHSPVFVLYMAEAEEKRGRLLAAKRLLEAVRDEPLEPDATEAFRRAKVDAAARLEELEPRIPKIRVVTSPAARVTIDGELVDATGPIEVEPGRHEIVAEAGEVRDSRRVDLSERQTIEVALDVTAEPTPKEDAPTDPTTEAGAPSWLWPAVGYGVGTVGLFMGAIAGGMFLSRQDALKEVCAPGDPNRCPPDQAGEIEAVQTLGDVATAGWVIAAVGAAAGTVLLFVLDDDTELRASASGVVLRARF